MSLYTLPIIELCGSYQKMGESLGENYRDQIGQLCDTHYKWACEILEQSGRIYSEEQLCSVIRECIIHMQNFYRSAYDEFYGIARGANLSLEYLFFAHMTDIIDVLVFSGAWHRFGCSSVIVCPDYTKNNQILVGQTWDWLTEDIPFFALIHRKPTTGIESWVLGILPSYSMGINAEGVTIGCTNLLTWDAKPGVPRSAIVQKALNCKSAQQALDTIKNANAASAHYHYLADKNGIGYGIESAVQNKAITEHRTGFYVHCNHALDSEIKKYENCSPDESTVFRQNRLTELLSQNNAVEVCDLKTYFADRAGGDLGIRQENTLGIYSTDACVIFSPQSGEFFACRGQADRGEWRHIRLR